MSTAHLTSELNAAALAPFERDKIDLTDAQKALLEVELPDVRSAVESLEQMGYALRIDLQGTPLREIKARPDGRRELQKLRNKTAIVVYAKPKPGMGEFSTCRQSSLLEDAIQQETKGEDTANSDLSAQQLLLDFMNRTGLELPPDAAAQYSSRPEVVAKLTEIQRRQRRALEATERLKAAEEALRSELVSALQKNLDSAGTPVTPRPTPATQPEAVSASTRPLPASTQDRQKISAGVEAPVNFAEVYTVLEVFRRHAPGADDEAAAELLRRCRSRAPGCTVVHVAEAIEAKAAAIGSARKKGGNPVGAALSYVPGLFSPAVVQQRAADAQAAQQRMIRTSPDADRHALEEARRILADPSSSDNLREAALAILGE